MSTTLNLGSNANSDLIAHLLQEGRVGTFTGLIYTKKGVVRGGKVYGDDTTQYSLFTGFKYERLVQRSLELLDTIDLDALVAASGGAFTKADADLALAEQRASFKRTLDPTQESASTTAHVYKPLIVNQVELDDNGKPVFDGGKVKQTNLTVRGSKVYKCVADEGRKCHCRDCTGEKRAPLDETIYLDALVLHRTVKKAAVNGPAPKPNSKPKTLAKKAIGNTLPTAKYGRFILEPGTDFILKVGGTARLTAANDSYTVGDAEVA